jgi:hypothetical protein
VHPDRLGDLAQDQWTQCLHASGEKGLLPSHDLGRNLDDRQRPLVQRLG